MAASEKYSAGKLVCTAPDPQTLVFDYRLSRFWRILFALGGTLLLAILAWHGKLPIVVSIFLAAVVWTFPLYGILFPLTEQPRVVLCAKTETLERFPYHWGAWRNRPNLHLQFGDIREFLMEPQYNLGYAAHGGEVKPQSAGWHLLAIGADATRYDLIFHMRREPIFALAQKAGHLAGKPVRETGDALDSDHWNNWGVNFVR
jgi:hypothetical protein